MSDTKYTEDVINSWNAQADEFNQWSELGEDEREAWAAKQNESPKSTAERIAAEYPRASHLKEKLERVASASNDKQARDFWKDALARAISEPMGISHTFLKVDISPRYVEISFNGVLLLGSVRIDFREDRFASLIGEGDLYENIALGAHTAVLFRNISRKFDLRLRKYVKGMLPEANNIVSLAHLLGVSA